MVTVVWENEIFGSPGVPLFAAEFWMLKDVDEFRRVVRVLHALLAAPEIRSGTIFVTGKRGFDALAGLDMEVIDLVR